MDIRRTVLWVIFSFSLLLLWNNWQMHNGRPSLFGFSQTSQTTKPPAKEPAPTGSANVPSAAATSAAPGAAAQEKGGAAVPGGKPAPVAESQRVQVHSDVYDLTFDTKGAQLIGAKLLKYESIDHPNQPMTLLDESKALTYLVQTGVIGAPAGANYPTHLTPFKLMSTNTVMKGNTLDIVFEAESDNVKVVKTYTLHRGSYDIGVKNAIYNLGTSPVSPSIYLQIVRDDSDPANASHFTPHEFTGPAIYSSEDKFQKASFSDIEKGKAHYIEKANNGWIAMVQHYFATAWVPPEGAARANQMAHLANGLYAVRTILPVGVISPGESKVFTAQLWAGPQDQQAMSAVAPGLDLVVDYGWLTIVAKPLFELMTLIHTLLGNWGWTIVALTLLIKAVFYPLSAASYRSMAKMKLVGPRMKLMREQAGGDKAKLNAAMMQLYKTEKINPLGGCLPMVVQVPVFISLYWVLLNSVEMRGAPWVLWIHDLSAPDPWFILPAVMMATMFLQIKLNPTPPDPTQAKIMLFMPLVFGGMMFLFPAGLVLYYCFNNAVSIIQQRYIMHRLDKEKEKA
ncbi:MAG: membrane protein insertase YidC, partial [Candidimonas sp.]